MKFKNLSICLLVLLTFSFQSCLEDTVDETTVSYSEAEWASISSTLDLPEGVDEYTSSFFGGNNERSDAKATLGRVLFYDNNLSIDNSTNCSSCHNQKLAFADDKKLSEGIDGRKTKRNSLALGIGTGMSLANYYNNFDLGFFWDERAGTIAEQLKETIPNSDEMGMEMHALTQKIKDLPYYKVLFHKAFQNEGLVEEHLITEALEFFISAMVTGQSKFELATSTSNSFTSNPSVSLPGLSEAENKGKNLFINDCASCHSATLSPFLTFALGIQANRTRGNNGLDMVYEDKGIGEASGDPSDNGHFKVPLLKNIAVTGPYMHDGRFSSLDEVVDFYSTGIQDHANLSEELKEGNKPMKFDYTQVEKDNLIAFLHTLTDEAMLTDPKFSDPFK